MAGMNVFWYGPPGSGKSEAGQKFATRLGLNFIDLDQAIEKNTGRSISQIFTDSGESGFRQIESQVLRDILTDDQAVISLGGGALLDEQNIQFAEERGRVIFLEASPGVLLQRLGNSETKRPLVSADLETKIPELLAKRSEHYASFSRRIQCDSLSLEAIVDKAQMQLGMFHVVGMGSGYDVRIQAGNLANIGKQFKRWPALGSVFVVSDENVAGFYLDGIVKSIVNEGYSTRTWLIKPGERSKNIRNLERLWEAMLQAGVERSSLLVGLGGGVVTDLAGFAASTYMRGINWAAVPTSLLGMADASLGGKTGVDLPAGKNLVGAFYPPSLVWADPDTIQTLPSPEYKAGLAEVIKAGVIGDPILFDICLGGRKIIHSRLEEMISRAMAVKIKFIEEDPYEKGRRAALNLGHTIGHALEKVSGYSLRHGYGVAIGMWVEAKLAEAMGVAEPGTVEKIEAALVINGLPLAIPASYNLDQVIQALHQDKKNVQGKVQLALPRAVGEVVTGVAFNDERLLRQILEQSQKVGAEKYAESSRSARA